MDDIWNQNPFSAVSLTNEINRVPFIPGRASQVLPWNEQRVNTTSVGIQLVDSQIRIINPTPRGGPGETAPKDLREMVLLPVPHYQIDDFINADEVQNVRSFGSGSALMTVAQKVNQRFAEHATSMDITIEYQRVGALKGIILNGNGTTLLNLYTALGVSPNSVVDFDLDNVSPVDGALREKCAAIVRLIANKMGGLPFGGVHAFVGDAFFDALLKHPEVRETYKNTAMAQVLREGYLSPDGSKIYGAFEFGGIVWENYRGTLPNGNPIIPTDDAQFFPTGVQGFFRTVFAPADFEDTVNTMGLPRYARQWPTLNGKGRNLEAQTNTLSYVTRPDALVRGTRT